MRLLSSGGGHGVFGRSGTARPASSLPTRCASSKPSTKTASSAQPSARKTVMNSLLVYKRLGQACLWLSERVVDPIDRRLLAISRWALSKAGSPSSTSETNR